MCKLTDPYCTHQPTPCPSPLHSSQPHHPPHPQALLQINRKRPLMIMHRIGHGSIPNNSNKQGRLGEQNRPLTQRIQVGPPHTSIISPRLPEVEGRAERRREPAVEHHTVEQGARRISCRAREVPDEDADIVRVSAGALLAFLTLFCLLLLPLLLLLLLLFLLPVLLLLKPPQTVLRHLLRVPLGALQGVALAGLAALGVGALLVSHCVGRFC